MKIAIVLGTRPEITKLSSIISELYSQKKDFFVVHTNQHYSENMDKIFFKELDLPEPKYNLKIGSDTHVQMLSKMLSSLEVIFTTENPDIVLVQGDTNSVLAGALTAAKMGIKIGHIEAGLRSYDRTMPEEINRILVDPISDYLFCPTNLQKQILLSEGILDRKIFVVGNTTVDLVKTNLKKALQNKDLIDKYKNKNYILLTSHRPSNVDQPNTLQSIISALDYAAKKHKLKILFPIHPRTKNNLEKFNIQLPESFISFNPVGNMELLLMQKYAKVVVTDSGGIQEEACTLHVPCVTIRKNTERPETITVGANILAGNSKIKIQKAIDKMIKSKCTWKNPFDRGHTAKKIIKIIRP